MYVVFLGECSNYNFRKGTTWDFEEHMVCFVIVDFVFSSILFEFCFQSIIKMIMVQIGVLNIFIIYYSLFVYSFIVVYILFFKENMLVEKFELTK